MNALDFARKMDNYMMEGYSQFYNDPDNPLNLIHWDKNVREQAQKRRSERAQEKEIGIEEERS